MKPNDQARKLILSAMERKNGPTIADFAHLAKTPRSTFVSFLYDGSDSNADYLEKWLDVIGVEIVFKKRKMRG